MTPEQIELTARKLISLHAPKAGNRGAKVSPLGPRDRTPHCPSCETIVGQGVRPLVPLRPLAEHSG